MSKITPHPALYEKRNVTNSTTQRFNLKYLKQKKTVGAPYSKKQFKKLLKNYQSFPKESHSYKKLVHTNHHIPLPIIPRVYILIPKHYKLTRTFSTPSHPMLLRKNTIACIASNIEQLNI